LGAGRPAFQACAVFRQNPKRDDGQALLKPLVICIIGSTLVSRQRQPMPLNHLVDSGSVIQPPPDVQRTTMSVDVLGRFICSTWDEAIGNGGAPFDAIVIGGGMFGGYCGDKISRAPGARPLRVLVLEAGPFLVPTHVQNLPRPGLNVPAPMPPAADNGVARELVWGMPWRSNVDFVGQAYCVGGKSLYWGGWCPRLQADDLTSWPPSVAQYLALHYPTLEQQTGVASTTDFIQGPLFNLLKARFQALAAGGAQNLKSVEDPPLAVQGQSPQGNRMKVSIAR
jgi:hypothetical protein